MWEEIEGEKRKERSIRFHGVGAAYKVLVLRTPVRFWVEPFFYPLDGSRLLTPFSHSSLPLSSSPAPSLTTLLPCKIDYSPHHCASPDIHAHLLPFFINGSMV